MALAHPVLAVDHVWRLPRTEHCPTWPLLLVYAPCIFLHTQDEPEQVGF